MSKICAKWQKGNFMLKEKIQLLVEHGMKVTTIAKEAGVPRSTFDYWFREGKDLNETHQERL